MRWILNFRGECDGSLLSNKGTEEGVCRPREKQVGLLSGRPSTFRRKFNFYETPFEMPLWAMLLKKLRFFDKIFVIHQNRVAMELRKVRL